MKSLIALHNKLLLLSLKCAKNQGCGFIRTYGGQVSHLLTHLLLYCRCMDLRKGILFKKIRNHSQPLKLQQSNKICHKLT